jgi:hypothetical protein
MALSLRLTMINYSKLDRLAMEDKEIRGGRQTGMRIAGNNQM